jgi:hypothetical protein
MTDTKTLPGILKTTKTVLKTHPEKNNASSSAFVGFNATHVHLDTSSPHHLQSQQQGMTNLSSLQNFMTSTSPLLLNNQLTLPSSSISTTSSSKKQQEKQDSALIELRSYTSLMDEFSLHNFMIWNGHTLRDTPEFQSYHRTYQNQWSYVETVIIQLEKLMTDNCIKLAIISGMKALHYSLLNLPYLQLYQLLDCVSNADQIRPQLSSFSGDTQDQILRATVKIQTLGRRWFAIYRYKNLKKRLWSAIVIQSLVRRYVQRCRTHSLQQQFLKQSDLLWRNNFKNLYQAFNLTATDTGDGPGTGGGGGRGGGGTGNSRYLLILIPTISASEFLRLNMSHLFGLQNSLISSLSLLADPRLDIIYITPCPFGTVEKNYIHKFLSLLGISTVPNRLKFVVPELTSTLPPTLPVSHLLWYSSATLRKLKSIIRLHASNVIYSATMTMTHTSAPPTPHSSAPSPARAPAPAPPLQLSPSGMGGGVSFGGVSLAQPRGKETTATTTTSGAGANSPSPSAPQCHVLMLSSEITWIEKRIAIFLGVSMMSPEPIVATEFSSNSQSKRLFMETNMNIPIGAHDIYTEEDLLIALTRLISSNLSISRWILRLNVDYNQESTVVFDTSRLPLIPALKAEQQMLMVSSGNDTESWYERHVQLNARKRILHQLKEHGLPALLTICRDDIYPTWSHYLHFLTRVGVVIEAEPPLLLGRIETSCFISPVGGLYVQPSGSQILTDEFYQKQGVVYPQSLIHPKAVEGACKAIGLKLYDHYGATGYFTVSYVVYRDAYDNLTRLWATGLKFGLSPSYCAIGTLAQLTNPFSSQLLSECPLVPPVVEGLALLPSLCFLPFTHCSPGRCCVYLPTAIHPPLSSSRDDIFFKLCKLNGISYDAQRKTGVLFFMVDGIVGESLPSFSLSLTVSRRWCA